MASSREASSVRRGVVGGVLAEWLTGCVVCVQPETQKARVPASSDDYVLDQLCICEEKLLRLMDELEASGHDVQQLTVQMDAQEVR